MLAQLQWEISFLWCRKACEEYVAEAEKLAFTLLELISESLGLPPHVFHEHFVSSGTSLFRLNHYPVCPAPHLALGVSRHKDIGALTILLQDEVGGLEVRRKDGEWIGIEPNSEALVINVGDLIQVSIRKKKTNSWFWVLSNGNAHILYVVKMKKLLLLLPGIVNGYFWNLRHLFQPAYFSSGSLHHGFCIISFASTALDRGQ